ncbi:hypothetical protein [Rhizobium fabae]|uniref:Uncharacterized protein n=1 Tax=Rhizobium fabae TaxID=573179 RepID=A0A7W6BJP7_9HYPH|nr:hypothetical protein [Rhizobium fabae]MBB3918646.1 hypothetical protein [Rhizobium fabae]
MTNLETRIITHPPIPLADITPLEMLILTNVLECSEAEAGLVLFTDFGPTNPINVKRHELIEAFRASAPHVDSAINTFIASRIIALLPAPSGEVDAEPTVDIDLSEFPWQFVVQRIVARSRSLHEVVVIQWMNHPSQRPETFGASVSLITAKAIHHATSEDLLARFRRQDQAIEPPTSSLVLDGSIAPTGGDAGRLFKVTEVEATLCIWEAMLYFRGLHEDRRPVSDNIVEMSKVWDAAGWQSMRSRVAEIVPIALDVYVVLSDVLERDGFTFDFDFVPAMVETLVWSATGPSRGGEPAAFADQVIAAMKRRRQDVIARTRRRP